MNPNLFESLKQQVGQLVMVGFDGFVPNAQIEGLIREQRIGGVILFRRNIESPAQVAALCRGLQAINAEVSDIPLLIAIDQEGGMVMRIEAGVTPLPSAMAYARASANQSTDSGSAADCETLHRIGAAELRQLGININFAPVLDINNNPGNPVIGIRAFGEDAATVSEYGLAAIRGIQAAGVAATAKHFPGHGDTAMDSHYALPVVPHAKARLDEVELAPFKAAIAAGVDAMMTAHVVFPEFEPDPNTPATLSHAVLTGLLRDEMGFDGVIFTDCLEMAAIASGVGVVAGAVQALQAGADLILVSHTHALQQATVLALQEQITSGILSRERVQQSLARIARLKQSAAVRNWAAPFEPQQLQTPEALALAASVQAKALQVSEQFQAVDLSLSLLLITVEVQTRTEIDEVALGKSTAASGTLLPLLLAANCQVDELIVSPSPTEAEISALLLAAESYPQVIVQSYNACLSDAQQTLLAQLPTERLWLVAGRLPYDLDLLPNAKGRLAAYSNRPAALISVAKKLLGQ